MRETKDIEFKEIVSNSFLKTVSAFANYDGGKIIFGIDDNGIVVGIDNTKRACLEIENLINGNLEPVPSYSLSIDSKYKTVTLSVMEGTEKPYIYKLNAYRRSDSSTVPVDRTEMKRLILAGQNMSFEELKAENQDLKFDLLTSKIKSELNVKEFNLDTLKTLELYTDSKGYNKAAELLADENIFCGIDIVRFGDSISIIHDREELKDISILKMYDESIEMFRKYYKYERINGAIREDVYLIPEPAFREAIANAIVHRTWDIDTNINVAMFPDRIEIVSPGGLPPGINEEEYLRGGISILRNRIIANIFFRLHMIERFGTGIRRINEEYKDSINKPKFEITQNSIKITLPLIDKNKGLSEKQRVVYKVLDHTESSSSMVAEATGFGKSKTIEILKSLAEEGYVTVSGNGRGTRYRKK